MMSHLKVETDERGCRTLWLDRPEKRNALDAGFLNDLLDAARCAAADETLRIVLLRSTSRVFCAGADLNDWADVSPREAQRLSALGSHAFQALAELPMPTVAVLEGPALGGGLELALACDFRIATSAATTGFPEPRLGNSPAWGGMRRLIEAVGIARARDLLLTGDAISALEAQRLGVIQRVSAPELFDAKLAELVNSILACDAGTLVYIKSLLGSSAQFTAAQEAAVAGFTATRQESLDRKQKFLSSRRRTA